MSDDAGRLVLRTRKGVGSEKDLEAVSHRVRTCEKSETPPIIILQSDHGQRPHHPGIVIGGDEWHKILNAMYLPGMDYAGLSDSISPVNTFRLIFNHYFDADYPLLEDDQD